MGVSNPIKNMEQECLYLRQFNILDNLDLINSMEKVNFLQKIFHFFKVILSLDSNILKGSNISKMVIFIVAII
jgi:hypothetical protein